MGLIWLRRNCKWADSLVFFTDIDFFFFKIFRKFTHTLCHRTKISSFHRKGIGLIFGRDNAPYSGAT